MGFSEFATFTVGRWARANKSIAIMLALAVVGIVGAWLGGVVSGGVAIMLVLLLAGLFGFLVLRFILAAGRRNG